MLIEALIGAVVAPLAKKVWDIVAPPPEPPRAPRPPDYTGVIFLGFVSLLVLMIILFSIQRCSNKKDNVAPQIHAYSCEKSVLENNSFKTKVLFRVTDNGKIAKVTVNGQTIPINSSLDFALEGTFDSPIVIQVEDENKNYVSQECLCTVKDLSVKVHEKQQVDNPSPNIQVHTSPKNPLPNTKEEASQEVFLVVGGTYENLDNANKCLAVYKKGNFNNADIVYYANKTFGIYLYKANDSISAVKFRDEYKLVYKDIFVKKYKSGD